MGHFIGFLSVDDLGPLPLRGVQEAFLIKTSYCCTLKRLVLLEEVESNDLPLIFVHVV